MNFGNKPLLRNSLIVNPAAGDISSPVNGEVWYNSSTGKFRKHQNGVTSNLEGISGTPAGSTTQIQYNNAGSFGASSNLTWDETNGNLTAYHSSSNASIYLGGSNGRILSEAGIGAFTFYSGAIVLASFGLSSASIRAPMTFNNPLSIVDNGGTEAALRLRTGLHYWNIQNLVTNRQFQIINETGGNTIPFRITTGDLIGIGGTPDVSAKLDIQSTTTGFLLPRMTSTDRTAIGTPATGLMAYQTDSTENLYVKKSGAWKRILTEDDGVGAGADLTFSGASSPVTLASSSGSDVIITAGTNITFSQSANNLTINAVSGGSYTVTTVTAATYNETATSGEVIINCNTTSNNITVNLPTAVGNTATITIKRISAGINTLTVDASASQTIDDGLTALIKRQYESITLISDNANWQIV